MARKLRGKVYETRATLLRRFSEPVDPPPHWKMKRWTVVSHNLVPLQYIVIWTISGAINFWALKICMHFTSPFSCRSLLYWDHFALTRKGKMLLTIMNLMPLEGLECMDTVSIRQPSLRDSMNTDSTGIASSFHLYCTGFKNHQYFCGENY